MGHREKEKQLPVSNLLSPLNSQCRDTKVCVYTQGSTQSTHMPTHTQACTHGIEPRAINLSLNSLFTLELNSISLEGWKALKHMLTHSTMVYSHLHMKKLCLKLDRYFEMETSFLT